MSAQTADRELGAARVCDAAHDGELHVVSPMFPGQPDALLAAIIAEAARRNLALTLYTADLSGRYEFASGLQPGEGRTRIVTIGGRVPERLSPIVDFLPMTLFDVDRSFGSRRVRVDAFVAQVGPPDTEGFCSYGPVVSYSPTALSAAGTVVLEVNTAFPVLPGYRGAHLEHVDLLVCGGADHIGELGAASAGPVESTIGATLAGLIPDGATVQLGIGAIPERFLATLSGHAQLRIHSGAIPEAAIPLIDSGVFTGPDGFVTTSLLGTRRLYEYAADPTHRIRVEPVSFTHAPGTLMNVGSLYSVNSAFEVDLSGQVNAEYSGGRKRASAGGQADFGRWAHLTGANIIALRARSRSGESAIVGQLSAPHAVTTQRGDVDFVVTEFGVADLRSRTWRQRGEALLDICAPEHREHVARCAFGTEM